MPVSLKDFLMAATTSTGARKVWTLLSARTVFHLVDSNNSSVYSILAVTVNIRG